MPAVIDLFSGVGGLSLGFRQAGFSVPVANEFDVSIANSYLLNHPDTIMINKDINELDIHQTFSSYRGVVAGVIGGPPCQGYSQKGSRQTINDPRNFLFRKFVETVETVDPQFFVMENVPNLLTAHSGYFAEEIRSLFSALGFHVTMQIVDARDCGVPQARKRAIIIGSKARKIRFQKPKDNTEPTIWDAISDLNFLSSGEGEFDMPYRGAARSNYQESMRVGSSSLKNHVATNHSAIALERMKLVREGQGRESLPAKHLTKSIYSGTWARMDRNQQAVTITTRFDTPSSGCFTHPQLDRAITVREAARLQSFPDSFVFYGTKTSQMKQVGNAVPPRLARNIAENIRESFEH